VRPFDFRDVCVNLERTYSRLIGQPDKRTRTEERLMRPLSGWRRAIVVLAALAAAAPGGAVQSSGTTSASKKGGGQALGQGQTQGNWPRKIKHGESPLSVDAPQAQSLEGNKLKGQSAVALDAGQGGEPAYGTVWLEADVDIQRDSRQVTLVSVNVP